MKEIIKEFERICVGANGEMITDPNVTKLFILDKLAKQKEEILKEHNCRCNECIELKKYI